MSQQLISLRVKGQTIVRMPSESDDEEAPYQSQTVRYEGWATSTYTISQENDPTEGWPPAEAKLRAQKWQRELGFKVEFIPMDEVANVEVET